MTDQLVKFQMARSHMQHVCGRQQRACTVDFGILMRLSSAIRQEGDVDGIDLFCHCIMPATDKQVVEERWQKQCSTFRLDVA